MLPVGIPINKLSDSKGNLSEIQSAGDVNRFFLWLHDVYGIVAAFYWGPRYTVSVASLKLIQELKAHEGSLSLLCFH